MTSGLRGADVGGGSANGTHRRTGARALLSLDVCCGLLAGQVFAALCGLRKACSLVGMGATQG